MYTRFEAMAHCSYLQSLTQHNMQQDTMEPSMIRLSVLLCPAHAKPKGVLTL
jgi:hypothetical protein